LTYRIRRLVIENVLRVLNQDCNKPNSIGVSSIIDNKSVNEHVDFDRKAKYNKMLDLLDVKNLSYRSSNASCHYEVYIAGHLIGEVKANQLFATTDESHDRVVANMLVGAIFMNQKAFDGILRLESDRDRLNRQYVIE
jgi:hypothetical protein